MALLAGKAKASLRRALALCAHASRLPLRLLKGRVAILMYHRVLLHEDLSAGCVQPGMYVKRETFDRQIKFLKKHFHVVSMMELLSLWQEKKWDKNQRYCVVTFDDGWLDNYIHAYPVLKKYGLPATIFLPTSFIGTDRWFWPDKLTHVLKEVIRSKDPEKERTLLTTMEAGKGDIRYSKMPLSEAADLCIERFKVLPPERIDEIINEFIHKLDFKLPHTRMLINWSEVAEMSGAGISFGSHSQTHVILTNTSQEKASREISESLRELQERKIYHVPVFCYPNGNCTDKIAEDVKNAGYKAAVTTRFGIESRTPENLFLLKRAGIHDDISAEIPLFSFRLLSAMVTGKAWAI